MTLQQLVAEAARLATGPCEAGHQWEPEGGRACPKDGFGKGGGCSQTVYRCTRCGGYDYGEKGGPAHHECHIECDYECDHEWEYHEDWAGDPSVINGTYTIRWMQCSVCKKTREATIDDIPSDDFGDY